MLLCFLESQLLQNYVAFPDFGARSVAPGGRALGARACSMSSFLRGVPSRPARPRAPGRGLINGLRGGAGWGAAAQGRCCLSESFV